MTVPDTSNLGALFCKLSLPVAMWVLCYHTGLWTYLYLSINTKPATASSIYKAFNSGSIEKERMYVVHGFSMFSLYDLCQLYLRALFIHFFANMANRFGFREGTHNLRFINELLS